MQKTLGRRRFLFGSALGLLCYLGYREWPIIHSPELEFEAVDQPPGFRAIVGSRISTGSSGPLIGLGRTKTTDPLVTQAEAIVDGGFCAALFGPATGPSTVRIAYFSDYYCPYCRVLTPLVARLSAELGSGVSVAWHEYPILGKSSRVVARAALAAKRQGAYAAFQERMSKMSFMPTPAYLADLCRSLGISFPQLQADMASEEVSLELAVSAALAQRFGFLGTPDLVIGKTVTQGAVEEPVVRRLIEIERKEGVGNICART